LGDRSAIEQWQQQENMPAGVQRCGDTSSKTQRGDCATVIASKPWQGATANYSAQMLLQNPPDKLPAFARGVQHSLPKPLSTTGKQKVTLLQAICL